MPGDALDQPDRLRRLTRLTRRTEWPAAGAVMLAALLPLMLARQRLPSVLLCTLHLLFAAFARESVRRNSPAVRSISVAFTASVLALCLVSAAYEGYKRRVEHGDWRLNTEAFRIPPNQEQWPLYGKPDDCRWPAALLMFPAAAALGWAVVRGTRRPDSAAAAVALGLGAAGAMFAFGFGDRPERTFQVYHDHLFVEDYHLLQARGVGLDGYVASMKGLSWFGMHYPPGNMLLLGPHPRLGAVALLLLAAAAVPLTYGAARSLGLTGGGAFASAALLATAPLVLMLATISSAALALPLAAAALWLCGRAIRPGRGGLVAAAGLGLLLAAWSFFSFGVAVFAGTLALALCGGVLVGGVTLRRAAVVCALAAAALAAALTALYLAAGYDTLAALREARANHYWQIGGFRLVPPRESVQRWLIRSAGNVAAFWVGHLPLTAAAALSLGLLRRRAPGRLAAVATAATLAMILAAGFDGTFVIETERIWLFFLPPLAVGGGAWASSAAAGDPRAARSVALISLVLATCAELFWKPFL